MACLLLHCQTLLRHRRVCSKLLGSAARAAQVAGLAPPLPAVLGACAGYTGGGNARAISIPLDVDTSGGRSGEWNSF